ncbi:MAG: hypothetical protein K0Q90_4587, partial [Paenibacillaceae bacterium]|nr:hypothetical protein [Paenibacillaceae bacterium]
MAKAVITRSRAVSRQPGSAVLHAGGWALLYLILAMVAVLQ